MAHVEFKEENQDFNKVIEEHKEKPTFVDFFADWCPPCRMLKPMLEKACQENGFNFISINVDQNHTISEEYNVQGIPYVVLFIKGKKAMDFTGANIKKFEEAVEMAKKGE
jgi:putative thioredoxin